MFIWWCKLAQHWDKKTPQEGRTANGKTHDFEALFELPNHPTTMIEIKLNTNTSSESKVGTKLASLRGGSCKIAISIAWVRWG